MSLSHCQKDFQKQGQKSHWSQEFSHGQLKVLIININVNVIKHYQIWQL